jgi:hypothetical protein
MIWVDMTMRTTSRSGAHQWHDLEHLVVLYGLRVRRSGTNHTFTNEDVEGAQVLLADPWPLRGELGHMETRGALAPRLLDDDRDWDDNTVMIGGDVGDNRYETRFIALFGHVGPYPSNVPPAEAARHPGTVRYIFEALPPPALVSAVPAGTNTHRRTA